MNQFSKFKPILAFVLAFNILFGNLSLSSFQVSAQETIIEPVSNEETAVEEEINIEQESIESEEIADIAEEEVINLEETTNNDLDLDEIVSDESDLEENQLEEMIPSSEFLEISEESDSAEAMEAFHNILSDHEIIAIAKESYEIKAGPDAAASVVKTIPSGAQVLPLDVVITPNKVWYQVEFAYNNQILHGYIDNENLVTSDSDFLKWKNTFDIDRLSGGVGAYSRSSSTNLSSFPESYRPYISKLISAHPNWTFIPFQTGLDWNTVIHNEMYPTRNLVPSNSPAAYKSIDSQFFNASNSTWYPQDSGNWVQASEGAVRYYMDPRNFLNEESVFQYELLTYSTDYTESGVEAILNGTFMSKKILEDNSANGKTYGKVFMELGKQQKVSPYFLASRIRQEQGVKGSDLISGTYPGYQGLYNYFNMGATGNNLQQVIESGLKEAKKAGWTTRYLSLAGGTSKVAEKYIRRGQDTLYLQKFDVDDSYDGLYWHQYMQNLMAADSEGKTVRRAYSTLGVLNNNFVFKVPVYNNMPASAVGQPTLSPKLNTPVIASAAHKSFVQGDLKWNKQTGVTGYRIYRKTGATGTYQGIATLKGASTVSYSDKNLLPNNTYYYKIRSYITIDGKHYYSPYSKQISVKTSLNKRNITKVVSHGNKSAKIHWNKNSGTTGYAVYRKTGSNGTYKRLQFVKGSNKLSFTDKTIAKNKTYYYKVRAYKTVNGKNYYAPYSQQVKFIRK